MTPRVGIYSCNATRAVMMHWKLGPASLEKHPVQISRIDSEKKQKKTVLTISEPSLKTAVWIFNSNF